MKNENDRLKRSVLSAIASSAVEAVIYEASHRVQREGRAEILRHVTAELQLDRLVLESRSEQDQEDARVLYDAVRKMGEDGGLVYEHVSPGSEPLLWVSDALAWAHGKGGAWSRRTRLSVKNVIKIGEP